MTIDTGIIRNHEQGKDCLYEIRVLDESYLLQIVELQSIVERALPDKELLVISPPYLLRQNLCREQGLTLGLLVEGGLAGYTSMHFLAYYEEGAQTDICFHRDIRLSVEELAQAALYKQAVLHSRYRGNSMLKHMANLLRQTAYRVKPELRYFCAMASPQNYASLNQLFEQGLQAVALKPNRYGWWRLVFFQDQSISHTEITQPYREVSGQDYLQMQQLLQQGYVGFGLRRTDKGTILLFGRNDKVLGGRCYGFPNG